jgi:uncharacterized protein (DUF1015 family)
VAIGAAGFEPATSRSQSGCCYQAELRPAGGIESSRAPAARPSTVGYVAEIQAFRALRYDLARTGGLEPVLAPPYDVIDERQRLALEARSPYNAVRIDLPRDPEGGDPYAYAARLLTQWRREGVLVRDEQPALWALAQDYTGPDGLARRRSGFLARTRVEEYGPGRIRPHERTHPGPREDRLRLTRATRVNLSPIFSLFSDADGTARQTLAQASAGEPWGVGVDAEGTTSRLWRVAEPAAIAAVRTALAGAELLIADGHHRYETARAYAEELGGEGPHRYVLMCLVALEDQGLTVFPTHRLVRGLSDAQVHRLAEALQRHFEIEALSRLDQLYPPAGETVRIGYIDAYSRRPYMLTLKDTGAVQQALPDRSDAYRQLDTAVLEALVLKGALGMTDEQLERLDGLGYARDGERALELVRSGEYDAAFMMSPTPVSRIQAIAAAGESMPPKSTYFFPKVPTGLVFNPLWD